uniref:Uncharacterized protein n=1 Tax=Globisporangium ultimum (strain ATCC 200006 / CBS 805.95 / DAOM BR144) TaxID=431595 RepID=K3WZE0_GLOUD
MVSTLSRVFGISTRSREKPTRGKHSRLPVLVLITLVDCVPLASPEEGTNANYVHWVQNS